MFYRYPRDSAQSLMVRTGYALLSGHLTANGTLKWKKPTLAVGFFAFCDLLLARSNPADGAQQAVVTPNV